MKNLVITLFGIVICVMISLGVMIFGWGLEPKSWWWILGGGVVIESLLYSRIVKKDD